MADRPILFSAPMIKALLAGTKTQTRRVLKPQPTMHEAGYCTIGGNRGPVDYLMREIYPQYMARFRKGDRLWVRETWSAEHLWASTKPRDVPCGPIWYWADGNPSDGDWTKPKPGIHMPRWASRLTLTVTDVRVQRLQAISAADTIAEGAQCSTCEAMKQLACRDGGCFASMAAFEEIWKRINGTGSWSANPWVVAVTFTVERRNIDTATIATEVRHD